MNAKERYNLWVNDARLDEESRQELTAIAGDDKQIEDRFYKDLEFGTGGLRGILGAGTNRMNVYTVRRAAAGLGDQLIAEGADACQKGVAIAHDSRRFSREFAEDSARVLAKKGIRVYLFDSLRPTPELSFTIKHLGCAAGIVVTASHNPAEYNGFKAYGADGGQITPATADAVLCRMSEIDPLGVEMMDAGEAKEKGLVSIIGGEVDDAYISHVLSLRPDPDLLSRTGVKLKIVYTPLHGAGNRLVRAALARAGYEDVTVVKEQELPDGRFPTVKSPNPENPEAFTLAIGYADRVGADVIIGTDPDSDRMGMMIRRDGHWTPVTGNQAGCLMLEYILRAKKPAPDAYMVTTVVSTRMVDAIAKRYGIEVVRVLTGFKFIGETIDRKEHAGNHHFLLGFEESYGYLKGTYARDKDAVVASMLITEMTAYYKRRGMTLSDALDALYAKYGFCYEANVEIYMEGLDGPARMAALMDSLRSPAPASIAGVRVVRFGDYQAALLTDCISGSSQPTCLPRSNVLSFSLENGDVIVVRPSGTEPKIKFYFLLSGSDLPDTQRKMALYRTSLGV